jgi:hypothetical protein
LKPTRPTTTPPAKLPPVEFWKIAIPALVAILLAMASYQFSVSRQITEQRRKQRVEYLIGAFRSLMLFSNNPDKQAAGENLREAAIAIQFFGTQEQSRALQKFLQEYQRGESDLDPLLFSLRNDLRKELDLGELIEPVYWTHPKPKSQ